MAYWAVSGVDETKSVATGPIEERRVDLGSRRDELGDDETNRSSSRRFGLENLRDELSRQRENRNNGSTSRNTNFVSDLTSYKSVVQVAKVRRVEL